jgi:LMBR1 domain-containing protein 1
MLHRFKQAVYFLKKDRDMLFTAHALKGGNPLWYFMKLFLGVIGTAISLSWLIHICIFVLPEEPFDPFLNNLFIKLEELGGRGR